MIVVCIRLSVICSSPLYSSPPPSLPVSSHVCVSVSAPTPPLLLLFVLKKTLQNILAAPLLYPAITHSVRVCSKKMIVNILFESSSGHSRDSTVTPPPRFRATVGGAKRPSQRSHDSQSTLEGDLGSSSCSPGSQQQSGRESRDQPEDTWKKVFRGSPSNKHLQSALDKGEGLPVKCSFRVTITLKKYNFNELNEGCRSLVNFF